MSTIELLKNQFNDAIIESGSPLGDDVVVVRKEQLFEILHFLKNNKDIPFDMLLDICGVDYPSRDLRFDVVYHLYSMSTLKRLRLKTRVSAGEPSVKSVISIWEAADWFEREAYDMFGIKFEGHPNLKRLLMWDEFEGHPLRKDYPVDKRQPIPILKDIV